MELPKTATLTLCLHMAKYGQEILPFTSDMSEYGYTYLGDVEVSVAVPQVDARARMAEMLRAEKQRVLAAAQIKANEIDEKIQSLLALEHKGEELA